MIIRLVLIIALIGGAYWAYQYLKACDPKTRKMLLIKYGFWGLIVLTVFAVATGRMHWLGIVIAGLLGVIKFGFGTFLRVMPLLKIFGADKAFSNPVFKTSFIEAKLDLARGLIEGQITDGPHTGKQLQELTASELDALTQFYRTRDMRSYYLIMVVKQRRGSNQQTNGGGNNSYADAGTPSIKEALQILGLDRDASEQDIVLAHRRLIQKLHPDRGGNDYLAARVNQAKDVLIKAKDN